MKINAEKRLEISKRKDLLANIKNTLKSEFVGIDNVIDNVIDSFEPWFVFPECVVKPIVINLWGMTGTGKTSLVRRLVELSSKVNRFIHIDIAEFSDKYNSSLKNYLTDDMVLDKNPKIFCIDEFQFARTISEQHSEIDRQGTRVIWEFIDTGKIYVNNYDKRTYFDLKMYYTALKECKNFNIEVKNGIVINKKKKYLQILDEYFLNYSRRGIYSQNKEKMYLLPDTYFDDIFDLSNAQFQNRKELKEFLMKLDLEDTISFIENILNENTTPEPIDLSNSVVFIIGNLDEAYQLSSDIDPDKDPDFFHLHSKQINLSTIKRALLKRFRHEQVSRLGNNHIIYPAFSTDNFRALINKELIKVGSKFNDTFGLAIEFSNNIRELIFKESVFPTEGARPVITSVNLLIESYFSKIINDICLKFDNIDKLIWDYSNDNYYINCYEQGKCVGTLNYRIQLKVEKDRKSKNSDMDAIVAVHECGHAIVAALTTRIIPKKISCVSANDNAEGSTILNLPEDIIITKKYIKDKIMIDLGGFYAEKIIFGEDNTSAGVEADLHDATEMALSGIKAYGMGSEPISINVPASDTNYYFFTKEKQQDEAMKLIRECKEKTEALLIKNKNLLKVLARELTRKLSLNADDIETIIIQYSNDKHIIKEGFINKEKYYDFSETLFTN